MTRRKLFALTVTAALGLLLRVLPLSATAAESDILWLPEGIAFESGISYPYIPELGWMDVRAASAPAIYDLNTGKIVEEFDDISPFSEGLASVSKGGKAGYIDHAGRVVIPLTWDEARDFHDGIAVVALEPPYDPSQEADHNSDYYLIDGNGTVTAHLGFEYSIISDFHDGVAQVTDTGSSIETWYINSKGEVVKPPEDTSVFGWSAQETDLIVSRQKDRFGLTDRAGNVILPYEYDYIDFIYEGPDRQPGRYYYVCQGDRFGLIENPYWNRPAAQTPMDDAPSSASSSLARSIFGLGLPMPWPMLWLLFAF